jgi:glycine/D-amino acid oxidase-like deaminating enzyme
MVEEGSCAVYGRCTPSRRLNLKPSNVLVLGAGIVGTASALWLQRDGHAVTLIDRDDPGQGCSFGNAGIIARYSVVPLASHATPRELAKMLLDPLGPLSIRWRYLPRLFPWLLRFAVCARPAKLAASAAALAALQQHTLEAYRALLDQVDGRDVVRSNGLLHPYESEKSYVADAPDRELRRRHGVSIQELSGDEAREIAPALAPSITRATFFPDCAHTVNPLRLVQVLVQDLVRRGGRIRRALVTGVEASASGVTAHTDGERYSGDAVVVALGAWSGRVAAALGSPVPLDTERGYHVVIPRPNIELDLPLLFPEYEFGATSMETGLRLAGTVELASLDAPPNYERARVLLRHGRRLFPGLASDECSEWMGLRPTLPDSLPVISRSSRHANVYYAFGHHHLGLTLAPITGRLIADMVAQRETSINLVPYRIDRF